MDRFKFRIPFYDNENNFLRFKYVEALDGIDAYNFGTCHHGEPEQCTGLKDKNGKLIYEHDLIKISGFDRIFQVVWLEEPACWGLKHQKDTSALCFMQGAEKEIIGNIHGNKDLLGDK